MTQPGDLATADGDGIVTSGKGDAFTVDTLLRGRVTLMQPARGLRASIDPVLLAAFIRPPFGRFADIGCGTGALGFLIAAADEQATGVGIEIQPRLAELAVAGLARNPFSDRVQIVNADVRRAIGHAAVARSGFDLVATNPPFRPVARGVKSPDSERAQAHHEVTLTLLEWLDCAAALVKPGGRVAVVFAAERLVELLAGLAARGLCPARLRLVHPRLDRPASRVLVEARQGRRQPLQIEPPLELHDAAGGHGDEVRRMLRDV